MFTLLIKYILTRVKKKDELLVHSLKCLLFSVCFKYILVVLAKDNNDNEVDPPMEIQVLVQDINDKAPVCEKEETVFEVQEDEPIGKMYVWLMHNP